MAEKKPIDMSLDDHWEEFRQTLPVDMPAAGPSGIRFTFCWGFIKAMRWMHHVSNDENLSAEQVRDIFNNMEKSIDQWIASSDEQVQHLIKEMAQNIDRIASERARTKVATHRHRRDKREPKKEI